MEVNKDALLKTKKLCHVELKRMIYKYNRNHLQLFIRFISKELHYEMIPAFIGLIAVFILSFFTKDLDVFSFCCYFFILGVIAIYEHLKNKIYNMDDLMKMMYLNDGRIFLYRILVMSLYQFLAFIILCFILALNQLEIVHCIFYALLPLYISQILAFHMMNFIKNVWHTFIIYIVCYFMSITFFDLFELIYVVTFFQALTITAIVVVIYMFNMIYVYVQKEGEKYGVNY